VTAIYPSIFTHRSKRQRAPHIATPAFTLFQVIVVIRAPVDRDRFGIPRPGIEVARAVRQSAKMFTACCGAK
jgi:hypothetical protein